MATNSSLWGDLFIPGFNTEDLNKFSSRDAYIEHLTGSKPGRKPGVFEPVEMVKPRTETGEYFLEPTKETLMDETLNINVVDELKKRIAASSTSERMFTLKAPSSLTVKDGGGFKKRPHIGGEEFLLSDVYEGKKEAVFVFKPVAVEKYETMEMTETQANARLNGFTKAYAKLLSGGLDEARKEHAKKQADEKERTKLADRFDRYEDFGSF